MAFLIVNPEEVAQEGVSGYISKSGIYDLTLKHAEVANTTNGAVQVNYLFDKCMSYGNNVIGINGQPTFGYKILEALAAILGQDELSDPEPTTVKFKKSSKDLMCIPELNDVKVKAWVQLAYRMYKGEIKEDVSVRRFYRESDGASGSEVLAILAGDKSVVIGERLGKDTDVASEIIYDDGVTADAVAAWKKAQQTATTEPKKVSTGGFPGGTPVKKISTFPTAK